MACSSTCPTQDHESFGACMRSKNLSLQVEVPGTGYSPSKNKAWDKRIDSYKDARRQGVLPASTKSSDIQNAVQASDRAGRPLKAQ